MTANVQKKIYLDVCCLNRPFDDQTQTRIRLEAQAVLAILDRIGKGTSDWITSEVVDIEIDQSPHRERVRRLRQLLPAASRTTTVGADEEQRARELEALGFHAFDALHVACAETAQVDVFLTTDDRLLRLAARQKDSLHVRVENPLVWLQELL